jgi:hypothetical protein
VRVKQTVGRLPYSQKELLMDLHGEIMNITVEKRKQNLAIDEAMKNNKNMKDILVAVYARGHRDARHSAAEKAAQPSVQPTIESGRVLPAIKNIETSVQLLAKSG